jgi:hypothetical protein
MMFRVSQKKRSFVKTCCYVFCRKRKNGKTRLNHGTNHAKKTPLIFN